MKAKIKQEGKQGYRDGYRQGYHLGLCEAVRQLNPGTAGAQRPLRLMYVPQGFDAIDAGVSEALAGLVTELIVCPPHAMLETAARESPEAVLVMNGLHVFPDDHLEQIAEIRRRGISTAIWFVDDPYFTEDTAVLCRHYDHVFTHELGCLDFYRSLGADSVHYLPLCVNPGMFNPRRIGPAYCYDIVFIGNAFFNRTELFDRLTPILLRHRTFIAGGFWERLKKFDMLSPLIHKGFIPPEETANYYSGAKLVINIHRPWESGQDNRNSYRIPAKSINPRTYEISACGAMQITDVREDLTEHYRPGYDLETFSSPRELESKIEYYLKHEKERRTFALRALRTTLRNHTFAARLPKLLDVIDEARARH
ncbi:CgeB family protein [Paenibacillus durus]|uniref:Spore maturation protein n=1 Tax=Paenibacillus durus ATCC 35681 TaxID=1333534 RepID=A0A0F7CJ90_PAEDU|nr:glycosyltransferase [Paenibacillus durus]AKG35966.1 spore maturation protein [Paenibacillus durus ATCC 35681]